MSAPIQSTFPQDECWKRIDEMLREQLDGVDVQALSDKDFNGGDLILTPPAVRTFYAGSSYSSLSDSQKLSYEATARFLLMCADEDLQSTAAQAHASARLADRVCNLVAGARINLPSGDQSMPVTIVAIEPLAVQDLGTAYGVGIEVPGLAQFTAVNAAGFTPGVSL